MGQPLSQDFCTRIVAVVSGACRAGLWPALQGFCDNGGSLSIRRYHDGFVLRQAAGWDTRLHKVKAFAGMILAAIEA